MKDRARAVLFNVANDSMAVSTASSISGTPTILPSDSDHKKRKSDAGNGGGFQRL
jgi:hypothetical protein